MNVKDNKTNAERILEQLNIRYQPLFYECDEFTDGIAVANKLNLELDSVFKTLVTVGKTGTYYVFVIPVAEELDLKKAARAAEEKNIEMLHVKDINKVTGYVRGGCSPIGMKKNYQTFIDETAQLFDQIFVSGGRIGAQIQIRPDDLVKASVAKYYDLVKS